MTTTTDVPQTIPAGYVAIGETTHPRRIDGRNVHGHLVRHCSGPYAFLVDSAVCLCDQDWAAREAELIHERQARAKTPRRSELVISHSPTRLV